MAPCLAALGSVRRPGRPVRPGWRRGAAGGFTLLEMLVAVAILSVLAGLLPRSFVYARALINRSESWVEARLVAEAVLHEELDRPDLRAGIRRGVIDNRAWTAVIEPSASVPPAAEGDGRILLQVKVVVPVSRVETLEVDTMRIGAP